MKRIGAFLRDVRLALVVAVVVLILARAGAVFADEFNVSDGPADEGDAGTVIIIPVPIPCCGGGAPKPKVSSYGQVYQAAVEVAHYIDEVADQGGPHGNTAPFNKKVAALREAQVNLPPNVPRPERCFGMMMGGWVAAQQGNAPSANAQTQQALGCYRGVAAADPCDTQRTSSSDRHVRRELARRAVRVAQDCNHGVHLQGGIEQQGGDGRASPRYPAYPSYPPVAKRPSKKPAPLHGKATKDALCESGIYYVGKVMVATPGGGVQTITARICAEHHSGDAIAGPIKPQVATNRYVTVAGTFVLQGKNAQFIIRKLGLRGGQTIPYPGPPMRLRIE